MLSSICTELSLPRLSLAILLASAMLLTQITFPYVYFGPAGRHSGCLSRGQAIDLMTRRLIASGQRPVTVGTFFSLGHSTFVFSLYQMLQDPTVISAQVLTSSFSIRIVIITSVVVAATASAVSSKFGAFSKVGGVIGTSVSAGFLIILGIMNIFILYKLLQLMGKLIDSAPGEEQNFEIKGAGCLFYLFKKMFKLIDRWDRILNTLRDETSG